MYIQNNPPERLPFSLPKGYSGSAFDVSPGEPSEPPSAEPQVERKAPVEPPKSEREPPPVNEHENSLENEHESTEEDAAPAFSEHKDRHGSGLFSRLPFLSSLLPPPRRGRGEKGALPEWAILGIVLFLLLDTPENDLLPFLLILFLWD